MARSPGAPLAPRPFAAVTALALVASAGLVAATSTPAAAATACQRTDPYSLQALAPTNATGGAITAGAKFGGAVAVGDFNSDGFADVAVGAPGDTVGTVASGTVSVFPGSATGLGTGVRLTQSNLNAGNEAGDQFGAALTAGDFNNDGYADLAVGIPGEAIGTVTAGALAVFYGKAAGLTTGAWHDQTAVGGGNEAGDQFGAALAAGDFNRDGFADLAVGLPNEAPSGGTVRGGAVAVFKGAAAGITGGWWADQGDVGGVNEAGDRFGAALAAGNVTGSAHADLVVGAPGEGPNADPAGSGTVYVVPGAASGKAAGFGRNQSGNGGAGEAGDNLGAALAVADFDSDGYADIAAGIPGEAPGASPAAGAVLVYPGAASQVGAGYWLQEIEAGETPLAGDRFGGALAAGDADADGYADLLIGARGRSYPGAAGAGVAFLFRGKARVGDATRALSPSRRIAQADVGAANEGGDAFGSAVGLGDLNGDGRADGIVGAAGEAPVNQPASGMVQALRTLVPRAAAALPVAQFSANAAEQASPDVGATFGKINYAYADNIGRLMHGHQLDPGNALTLQWTAIQGAEAFTGQPALGELADGRLQIVALSTKGELWSRTQQTKTPPVLGPWVDLGGPVATPPVMARQPDGRLVLFAVDGAGALWALQQQVPNGPYASWLGLGVGGLAGPVVATPVADGVQVFARDTAGDLRTMRFANGAVSGCTSLGDAQISGAPAVVSYPGNRLRLFARTVAGVVVTMRQDDAGAFPATWSPAGSFTASGSPSALLDPVSGRTEVVARGADGGIYGATETVQGSGEWPEWARRNYLGEVAATDPTAFPIFGASGITWGFIFRTSDNEFRLYQPSTTPAGSARARAGGAFTGTTLPAPPR